MKPTIVKDLANSIDKAYELADDFYYIYRAFVSIDDQHYPNRFKKGTWKMDFDYKDPHTNDHLMITNIILNLKVIVKDTALIAEEMEEMHSVWAQADSKKRQKLLDKQRKKINSIAKEMQKWGVGQLIKDTK